MGYQYQQPDLLIYKAVFADNWDLVSNTFKDHPELRTNPLNDQLETPLMIAMGTNQSHNFVNNLLFSLSKTYHDVHWIHGDVLAAENNEGDTALHYAAKIGNMIDAKLLISYSSNKREIVLHENKNKATPVQYAASFEWNKEVLEFFYSLTVLYRLENTTPALVHGNLLVRAIEAGFLGT